MGKKAYLKVVGIEKYFSGVAVLEGVSMECRPGEVLGVVGENGAGKSTLMKIVAGVYAKDGGRLYIDGREVDFRSPSEAKRHGISMVFQDTKLIPDLTVSQNVWLGHEPLKIAGFYDGGKMRRDTRKILDMFGVGISPDAHVRDLAHSEKQVVEIARALAFDTKLLILDEPTAALSESEFQTLLKICRDLKARGTSIVFISHRIRELFRTCDRMVVLRDGRLTGEMAREEFDEDALLKMMVGREVTREFAVEEVGGDVPPAISVEKLGCRGYFHDVDFSVRRGEVLGVAGIQGNGQRELVRAIAGAMKATAGKIAVNGREIADNTVAKAASRNISYLTNDRRNDGLFMPFGLRQNITIPNFKRFSRFGFIGRRKEEENARDFINRLNIKLKSIEQAVENLSGGNQQKVLLATRLAQEPDILILDEPTVGVDVATKQEIYRLVHSLAQKGVAIIVASSDLTELIGICNRILVMCKGGVVMESFGKNATEEEIIAAATTGEGKIGAPPAGERASRIPGGKRGVFMNGWANTAIVAACVALICLLTSRYSPYFLGRSNIYNLLSQLMPLGLIVLGQSIVLLAGGIDLSTGMLTSMVVTVGSYTVVGTHDALGILACAAFGLAAGLLNGLIITLLKVPDIITTIATSILFNGVALIMRPSVGGAVSRIWMKSAFASVGRMIPIATIVVVALFAAAEFWLKRSRRGTYLYAVGSNREIAFYAGLNANAIKVASYAACGLLTGIAAVYVIARIGTGDPRIGETYTLSSVTGAVIGGVSLAGGKGNLIGALMGAVLIIVIQNALNMLQVSSYYQYVFIGLLTLAAVVLQALPGMLKRGAATQD